MSEQQKPKKPKIPRQKMPEQNPIERAHNFYEVALGYDNDLALLEASRCLHCKKPYCMAGCPVEVDIPDFVEMVKKGDFIGAAWKVKEKNSLPRIAGRVCPQESQCESKCVLGKKGEPCAIGRLERFVADYAAVHGEGKTPELPKPTGLRVGVVGSGPAGLTLAGALIKKGVAVTVFEALHELGGVLVYGIPEFRLPKAIVKSEVDELRKLGVEFKTNWVVGRIETVDDLLEKAKFDGVFIGTGAGAPLFLKIPGENLNGVYSANEFLTRANLMKAYLFPQSDTPTAKGRRVVVFGGGNVAMDSARSALRLGAEEVTIVYRRTMEELPARAEEVHHAVEEGIKFQLLTAPTEIIGNETGWAVGVHCQKMVLGEPDNSGRRRPMPTDEFFDIECDTVIVSIGNGANPLVPSTTKNLETNKWGNIVADLETGKTSKDRVWAGGDIVTGAATVILAMGAGRKAALSMLDTFGIK
ncbi:NADPH-dependent glutamate synthase [Desulfomonile tiedjei]|uniref:NADPH-dependent glutamate synthase, homotetrameric n=1 Tax=Desulfomonile tiedjei (strain ATCC 49306 / DSM 6799 / DCB-1) TaxID=706587 RepID=I4C6C6_DESTA|nr:NADPH-dependent glutamate synthase [Desulfomonile tiedjei]AFM25117.1 NADPH-dependent glutamate synthase, homotetrameric [Desulfomonile tiedjei DSM 6799]